MKLALILLVALPAALGEQRVNCEPYRLNEEGQPLYHELLEDGNTKTGWQVMEDKCKLRDHCEFDRSGCAAESPCTGPLADHLPRCHFKTDYFWRLQSTTEYHQMLYANITAYSDDHGEDMVINEHFPGYREQYPDYPPLVKEVRMYVDMESSYRVHIKIEDPATARFHVPSPWGTMGQPVMGDEGFENRLYDIEMPNDGDDFWFNLRRKDGPNIFNTRFPGFIFEDQFLQITAAIPTDYVYGFGEHFHLTWKHDFSEYSRFAMFTRPVHPDPSRDENLYGHHPFYMGLDVATSLPRSAYGVFFLNCNAQEVDKIPADESNTPALTFRTIGGILDFYFFFGPSPEQVIQQYQEAIGRPYLVPYWSLGFQMSQYWWGSLDEVKNMYKRMVDSGIPWDVVHHDIDYMDNERDFTVDGDTYVGLGDWDREIQAAGMRVVIMLDPFLSFGHLPEYAEKQRYLGWFEDEAEHGAPYVSTDTGFQLDVWTMIENPEYDDDNTKPERVILEAKVWPGWPQVTHKEKDYYTGYIIDALENRSKAGECYTGEYGDYCHAEEQKVLMRAAIEAFHKDFDDDHPRKGHGHRLCHDHLDGLRDFQIHYCRAILGFPDWWKDTAKQWWKTHLKDFHDEVPYDAIWIDMNEPSNSVDGSFNWRAESYDEDILWVGGGCPDNRWNFPPWYPREADYVNRHLFAMTLCMSATHLVHGTPELHYNMHSLYSSEFAYPTWEAVREITNTRSFVFTRSSFAGIGKYIGHWLGDNNSTWEHLQYSTIGLLEFNLFGIPYNGADICGFFGETSPALCMRWLQLGAFYGFWRSHSMKHSGFQDPPMFGDDVVKGTIRVHNTRYSMMPYWYTLFYRNSIQGGTVARSMMAEFYLNEADAFILEAHDQFMIGSALLVAPALYEGVNDVNVYLPGGNSWYDWYSGEAFAGGQNVTVHVPLYDETPPAGTNPNDNYVMRDIGLFLRGGHVIPRQEPANNTRFSRLQPMGAVVALNSDGKAEGELFWDDGESADTVERGEYHHVIYSSEIKDSNTVELNVVQAKRHESMNEIRAGAFWIYGVPEGKSKLYYRVGVGSWKSQSFDYDSSKKVLHWAFDNDDSAPLMNEELTFAFNDLDWEEEDSAASVARPAVALLLLGFVVSDFYFI